MRSDVVPLLNLLPIASSVVEAMFIAGEVVPVKTPVLPLPSLNRSCPEVVSIPISPEEAVVSVAENGIFKRVSIVAFVFDALTEVSLSSDAS